MTKAHIRTMRRHLIWRAFVRRIHPHRAHMARDRLAVSDGRQRAALKVVDGGA